MDVKPVWKVDEDPQLVSFVVTLTPLEAVELLRALKRYGEISEKEWDSATPGEKRMSYLFFELQEHIIEWMEP